MDIVQIFNGLGNQMSQYAFYLAKKKCDSTTKCLYYADKHINQHNGFELERVFGIKDIEKCNSVYGKILTPRLYSNSRKGKKRQIIDGVLNFFDIVLLYENMCYDYEPRMLENSGHRIAYFNGGWHSYKYFISIREQLLDVYSFDRNALNEKTKTLVEKLSAENSVSIHVRRGDFCKCEAFCGVCTPEYYEKAIEYIRKHVDNPQFYVLSDDFEWVRENMNEDCFHIIDWNSGADSWQDMFLMSQCKHNINANSTFSWWGAWLNKNENKIVVVPERFFNLGEAKDVYPESWIKIN